MYKDDYRVEKTGETRIILSSGTYFVNLVPETEYREGSTYIVNCQFEGNNIIIDGVICDSASGELISYPALKIRISDNAEFYYYNGYDDSKEYISKSDFEKNLKINLGSGLTLQISIGYDGEATSFGFYS